RFAVEFFDVRISPRDINRHRCHRVAGFQPVGDRHGRPCQDADGRVSALASRLAPLAAPHGAAGRHLGGCHAGPARAAGRELGRASSARPRRRIVARCPDQAREAAMSQKHKAMKILDAIFVVFTMMLVMAVAGLPVEWLLDLVSRTSLAIEGLALAVASAAVGLIYTIAGSE